MVIVIIIVSLGVSVVYYMMKNNSSSSSPPPGPPIPGPIPGPTPDPPDALLQKLWRGKGLLNTSFTLQVACPGFFNVDGPCPEDASKCRGGVLDIADVKKLNNIISSPGNGIPCFSLATSLQNSRLAQIVFGPFLTGQGGGVITGDTNVGIFLDLVPLQKYIGCMSLLDALSEERYGNVAVRIPQAMNITTDDLHYNHDGLMKRCYDNDDCGLFMAGCGGSKGVKFWNSQKGVGYNFVSEPFDPPVFTEPSGQKLLPKGYFAMNATAGAPGTAPLFEGTDAGLKAFEETLIKTQNIVGQQANKDEWDGTGRCKNTLYLSTDPTIPNPVPTAANTCSDYWSYQFLPQDTPSADGYRENEVDIFIPQKPEAKTAMDQNQNCIPTDQFVNDFRQAIVGVYATGYCAKDVQWQGTQASPCCNKDISMSIAKAIAARYNATPGMPRKIDAWWWDVLDPTGKWSAPSDPNTGKLNLTLIPQNV